MVARQFGHQWRIGISAVIGTLLFFPFPIVAIGRYIPMWLVASIWLALIVWAATGVARLQETRLSLWTGLRLWLDIVWVIACVLPPGGFVLFLVICSGLRLDVSIVS